MTQTANSPATFGRLLAVTSRPQNVVFSGVLALVVTTLQGNFRAGLWAYLLLFVLYTAAATYNNLHDVAADQLNHRTDNPFSDQRLTARSGYVWLGVQVAVTAVLQVALVQPVGIVVTVAYFCLLAAYSHRTVRLQARGLVAPFVLACCYGGLPVLLASGQVGRVDWWLAGIVTLLCVPLLLAKDYKDLAGDRATGKRTALVRYGAKKVWRISLVLACCGCTATIGYLYLQGPLSISILALSAVCLALYLYSVWYVHQRQIRRPAYFLRLPQAALIVLAGCLTTL